MAWVATDDFESYSTGALAGNNGGSGWSGAWANGEGTGANASQVVDTPTLEGTRAGGWAAMTGEGDVGRNLTTAVTEGSVRFIVRRSVNDSDNYSIYVRDSGSNYRTEVLRLNSAGNMVDAEGSTIQAYSANTNYTIDVAFNTSTQLYDIRVDEGTWSTGIAMSASQGDVTGLTFRRNNSGAGTNGQFFDAIQPTPAAAATETASHTVDALLKKALTDTHTLDALLRKALTAAHSLDALLEIPPSTTGHSIDALLKKALTDTHTLDALIDIPTLTASHTLDSYLFVRERRPLQKAIFARVSLPSGERLADWHHIRFMGFSKALNAGLGECTFTLGVSFDYDGNDLRVGNDVELIVTDEDTVASAFDGTGARLVYKGYISLIERSVEGAKETVRVHVLGYYTLLALDVLKNGTQTTLYSKSGDGLTTADGDQSAADIGAMMRAVLDRYNAENTTTKIFYNGENDIPDTGTTATYTFQRKTYRQALDTLKSLAPQDVYWYADETGRLTFKPKPSSPTHTFISGRDFSSMRLEESFEKVRNFLLVWNGDAIHNHYQDAASINTFGRRAEIANDYGLANDDAADELGDKFLAENKQPEVKIICTILDNADGRKGYDIESIQPGDTCTFVGLESSLADLFRDNMLITKVDYALDRAIVEVEIVRSGLLDLQARHGRDISEIGSGGLGVPETYS